MIPWNSTNDRSRRPCAGTLTSPPWRVRRVRRAHTRFGSSARYGIERPMYVEQHSRSVIGDAPLRQSDRERLTSVRRAREAEAQGLVLGISASRTSRGASGSAARRSRTRSRSVTVRRRRRLFPSLPVSSSLVRIVFSLARRSLSRMSLDGPRTRRSPRRASGRLSPSIPVSPSSACVRGVVAPRPALEAVRPERISLILVRHLAGGTSRRAPRCRGEHGQRRLHQPVLPLCVWPWSSDVHCGHEEVA